MDKCLPGTLIKTINSYEAWENLRAKEEKENEIIKWAFANGGS